MKDVDLHLISIFDAVMTEGSITRAAERLAMTQSAVSNAVARMRLVWNDPLFIRDGRGIKPSARAQTLWREIEDHLSAIRAAAMPARFDPATSQQVFRVALTDYTSGALWPLLRAYIEREAPQVSLYAVPYTSQGARQQLADNDIDLCIGALGDMGSEIRTEPLFSEGWVCAMRRDHPLAKAKLTRDAFLKADHLLVSLSGSPVGVADAALDPTGKRRRVAMTLNNFGGVPSLLLSSDLICVLPAGAIRTHALRNKIHVCPVPIAIAPFQCRMAWHVRHHRAQAHDWMRALIVEMCTKVWS